MTTRDLPASRTARVARALAGALLAGALLAACSGGGGSDGKKGDPGDAGEPPPTDQVLLPTEDAPGVNAEVIALEGGSGDSDHFEVGDTLSVVFRLTKDDGTVWALSELTQLRALLAGPTYNYQLILPQATDLLTASEFLGDGTYRYTFASPIPDVFPAPYNDTDSFGAGDGELQGEPLPGGTYTLSMYGYWSYTVGSEGFRDVVNVTHDFLLGSSGELAPRAVVTTANCNQCHQTLQAHGGSRQEVTLCLACHGSGAEDRNTASVAGGTPGVTIDFKVMIHKLHNAAHLPSVLGVTTDSDGTRDYAATPQPYQMIGFGNSLIDFSAIAFPVMPSAYVSYLYDAAGTTYQGTGGNGPMPRDTGFSALTGAQKALEDRMRTTSVSCVTCHGDPDGAGPLEAPEQGDLIWSQPSRAACGSCHDDVVWEHSYEANGAIMPPQDDDASCKTCHAVSGGALAVQDAHLHPYLDPDHSTGIVLSVDGVSGGTGPSGVHQAGDPVSVSFRVTDEDGADLQVNTQLTRLQMIVTGPTISQQWLVRNVNPLDFAFRKSTPFTGNGTATGLSVSDAAVAQTIAVVFGSSTSFDVVGSVSATLSGQALGAAAGSTAAVSYNGAGFTLTQGSTAFAAGDRFYLEVVPKASSYAMNVPLDITTELLGTATGGADSFAVGNAPSYWGRQVVWERTALVGAAAGIQEDVVAYARYVVADSSLLALAVNDRIVLDDGSGSEEYLQIGRVQTTDDATGVDLGAADRIWFTAGTRYAHSVGADLQEVTLSSRREGTTYTHATSGATGIDLVAGQFTAGNRVVASYRTDATFGFRNAPGEALQEVYGPMATGDSDDIGSPEGDWKGLPLADGTYTVALWANRDFTLTPAGALTTTEAFNAATNVSTDNTTYRRMAEPATAHFLYGAATELDVPELISSGATCNACHGDLASHGFGRRGLDTCLACHEAAGAEDAAKYSFSSWYTGPTPDITMDFRVMVHKIHMGKELTNASSYVVNGIFLGVPYPVTYEDVGFPAMPGGASDCRACHGQDNEAWFEPLDRDHPDGAGDPALEWKIVCTSCHDDDDTAAHVELQTTPGGAESCGVCHGEGKELSVELAHKVR